MRGRRSRRRRGLCRNRPHCLDVAAAQSIFLAVTLALSPDGSVTEAPTKRGRPRTHFPRGERREILLTVSYQEIAEAQPAKLREIIERADALRIAAKARGDRGLERSALAILKRAQRRLNWFLRQGEKA